MRKGNNIKALAVAKDRDQGDCSHYFAFAGQLDLPGLPAPQRCCLRCGEAIPAPKRTGRPVMFCSDACRQAQAGEQRREWLAAHQEQDRPSSLVCEACGGSFAAPAIGRGRYPAFCSQECRGVGHRKRAAGYRLKRSQIKTVEAGGVGQKSENPSFPDRRGNENLSGASFPKDFSWEAGDQQHTEKQHEIGRNVAANGPKTGKESIG